MRDGMTKTELRLEELIAAAAEREQKGKYYWELKFEDYNDLFKRTTFFEVKKFGVACGKLIKEGNNKYLLAKGEV